MHALAKTALVCATLGLSLAGTPRLGSRALVLFKNLPTQKHPQQNQQAQVPANGYPPHLIHPMYPVNPMYPRGPIFPPPPPYLQPMHPFLPYGPHMQPIQPIQMFPIHGPGFLQGPVPLPHPVHPMVTPFQIHSLAGNPGGNLAAGLAATLPASLANTIAGGGSISAGPTYLIQELRHHNTPSSAKSQPTTNTGNSNVNVQPPEKILFLKDLKAFNSLPSSTKNNKKLVLPTPQDSMKGLGPEILPPIVLNANTLAQLGLGGLSGPVTGGLLPDIGPEGLHIKGGNAIW
ncbi:uncharacterized protein LOC144170143 [Haemaphysalis longicornis]